MANSKTQKHNPGSCDWHHESHTELGRCLGLWPPSCRGQCGSDRAGLPWPWSGTPHQLPGVREPGRGLGAMEAAHFLSPLAKRECVASCGGRAAGVHAWLLEVVGGGGPWGTRWVGALSGTPAAEPLPWACYECPFQEAGSLGAAASPRAVLSLGALGPRGADPAQGACSSSRPRAPGGLGWGGGAPGRGGGRGFWGWVVEGEPRQGLGREVSEPRELWLACRSEVRFGPSLLSPPRLAQKPA